MSDLISRQKAVEAIVSQEAVYADDAIDILRSMPTAQPEIIRCKDCKYSEHWYKDKRRCFLWHEAGIDVFEDGYCSYADRGQDE